MVGRWFRRGLWSALLLLLVLAATAHAKELWGVEPRNLDFRGAQMYITNAHATAPQTATVHGFGGPVATYTVPPLSSVVHVFTGHPTGTQRSFTHTWYVDGPDEIFVTVLAGDHAGDATSDASRIIARQDLGNEYYAVNPFRPGDQTWSGFLSIVAVEDATTVSVTPSKTTNAGGTVPVIPAGTTATFVLNKFELLHIEAGASLGGPEADLTGSHVVGDKNFAIYAGYACINHPGTACDTYQEQLHPTVRAGTEFVACSQKAIDPTLDDRLKFIATAPGATTITLDPPAIGGISTVTLSGPGEWKDVEHNMDVHITSDKPVQVVQGPHNVGGGMVVDPAYIELTPVVFWQGDHHFPVPSGGWADSISLAVPSGSTVDLDGLPVTGWTPVGTSSFGCITQAIADGDHVLRSDKGSSLTVFGRGSYSSYYYVSDDLIAEVLPRIEWDQDFYCETDPVVFLDNSTIPSVATWSSWRLEINTTPPTVFTYGTPPSSGPTWRPPDAGVYLVTLNATASYNGKPLHAEVSETLVIEGCPIADFSCAQLGHPDWLDVVFNDASTDADDNIISWAWTFGDAATAIGRGPLVHGYPSEGHYDVTLAVLDDHGLTSSITKPCFADDNVPPVLVAPDVVTIHEGEEVAFHVTASDADLDPLSMSWSPGDVPGGPTWNSETGRFHWRSYAGTAGVYEGIRFIAADPYWITEQTVQIRVLPVGEPPPPQGTDSDGDGVPDPADGRTSCDACALERFGERPPTQGERSPSGLVPPREGPDPPIDSDGDGVLDPGDNCVHVVNGPQRDLDGDGIGDACDPDVDGDLVLDHDTTGRLLDNCRYTPNPLQEDADGDGVGDACQGDRDADGVQDGTDNCLWTPNALQEDEDGDGVGDACTGLDGPSDGTTAVTDDAGTAVAPTPAGPAWAWLAGGAGIALAAALLVLFAVRRRRR